MSMNLEQLLRQEGLNVVPISGWESRRARGSFAPVGVMNHHTAGRDSLNTVVNGRPGLPPPLCNVLITKDGTVFLVAEGRANDSGNGLRDVLNDVLANRPVRVDAKDRNPNEDNINGNPYFYDIEVENLGNGADPYPAAQLHATVVVNAVLCREHGWSPNRCIHHRQWTKRKIDMSYRYHIPRLVREYLDNKPREEEDTMKHGEAGGHVVVTKWKINEYLNGQHDHPMGLVVTGANGAAFDDAMKGAVEHVQRQWGFPQTGVVDANFHSRIDRILDERKMRVVAAEIAKIGGITTEEAVSLIDGRLGRLRIELGVEEQ